MSRGPLFDSDYRPLFSGHETFPLRYGWLKKAYSAVSQAGPGDAGKKIFLNDESVALFGVGRNMVGSIRHWATCAGVIEEDEKTGELKTTKLGTRIFGERGFDPFLVERSSLWLLHWNLASGGIKPLKTTWFWAFSHYPNTQFRREDLVDGIVKFAEARSWKRCSRSTIQRDVECFVRTYETHPSGSAGLAEDALESPLAELGLIRGHKGNFHMVRGKKPSLKSGVFAIALDEFWKRYGTTRTLSFEVIAHEPGSPGRVFLLDEADLGDRLLSLEDATKGRLRWSETAGLKQVIRERPLDNKEIKILLKSDYRQEAKAVAA